MATRNRRKRRKTRNNKKNIIFLVITVILVILVVISGILIYQKKSTKPNTKTPKNTKVEKNTKTKEYKTNMIMAGDNLIHSSLYKDANKNANYNGYDFKPMYELIKPIVSKYYIKYYNQETVLGGTELGLSDYPTFNSPQEAGDAMIDAGFNLVSLATNHTMDSGEKAVLAARKYWDNQKDVLAVGSYASLEKRNEVDIRKSNNISYTMLNYTYGTNGMSIPSGKDYLVNVWPTDLEINDPEQDTKYQAYKKTVKEDIERVRDKVDLLIVAMHWGIEYTDEPTAYEKDMAKYLASLGVDIIVGTHPHVIQPVTWIDDTLVVYSLGNLISAQYQDANYNKMVGLMTSVDITKTEKNGKTTIKLDNVNNELTYTYYLKYRNFKVVPFSNQEIAKYLPNYKNVYETYKKVVQKYDDNMQVVSCYE